MPITGSCFFPMPSFCPAAAATTHHGQCGQVQSGCCRDPNLLCRVGRGFALSPGLRPCLHRSWLISKKLELELVASAERSCHHLEYQEMDSCCGATIAQLHVQG